MKGRAGAGRNHAAKGVAANAPPGNPYYWWDFTDITQMFTDTSAETAVVANDDVIAAITDKGSRGTTLTQATADDQPNWESTGLNDVPAAYFDGNDALFVADGHGSEIEVPFSVCLVYAQDATATGVIVAHPDSSAVGLQVYSTSDNLIAGHNSEEQISTEQTSDEVWNAGAYVLDDSSPLRRLSVNWNATDVTAEDATGARPDDEVVVVGANGTSGTTGLKGQIGEVLFYNTALTTDELAAWKVYTTTKYGVAWA